MMKRLTNSSWSYRGVAFIFAILLFIYVNNGTTIGSGGKNDELLANQTETVSMPLQIKGDTDKYYITGYPAKVDVNLDGQSALVTAAKNTKNFKVIADLTNLGVGEHTVTLKTEGLSSDITATTSPRRIKVKIQNKAVKTFPIQVSYNKNSVAAGYTVGEPTLSTNVVEVTGATSEVNKVDQVVAVVPLKKGTSEDVDQGVILQALDAKGNQLSVLMNPQTVRVQLPINMPTKKVPLVFEQTGTPVEGYTYAISSETNNVTVQGSSSTLKDIQQISLDVDVSKVTKNESRTLTISLDNNKVTKIEPSSVKVQITVTRGATSNDQDAPPVESSSSSASSSSSSSSSKQSESSSSAKESSSSSTDNK